MLLLGVVVDMTELHIINEEGETLHKLPIMLPRSFDQSLYHKCLALALKPLEESSDTPEAFLRIRSHSSTDTIHHYYSKWFKIGPNLVERLPQDSWYVTPILGTGQWYLAHESGPDRSRVIDCPAIMDKPIGRIIDAAIKSGHPLPGDDITIPPFAYAESDDTVILTQIECYEVFPIGLPTKRISSNHWQAIEW